MLVVMTIIPPHQYHAAGKCFFKPGETLFYLQAFPFVPGSLICKFTFLVIFDLYIQFLYSNEKSRASSYIVLSNDSQIKPLLIKCKKLLCAIFLFNMTICSLTVSLRINFANAKTHTVNKVIAAIVRTPETAFIPNRLAPIY